MGNCGLERGNHRPWLQQNVGLGQVSDAATSPGAPSLYNRPMSRTDRARRACPRRASSDEPTRGRGSHIYLFLALSLLASGCHVVERSRNCQKIADALEESHAALAPALPANPSPDALAHKAKLYAQLRKRLEGLGALTGELDPMRRELVEQLGELSRKLDEAADAVSDANEAREAADEAERKAKDEAKRKAERTAQAEDGNAAAPGATKPKNPSKRAYGPGKRSPAAAHRERQNKSTHRYAKARAGLEKTTHKVEETMQRLNGTCR